MQHCDTLISARWCVPVEPAGTVLSDHDVAINDGRIVAILPADDARRKFQPSVSISRQDHVLVPGFVNAHTHAAMTLMRGLADDLPLKSWLRDAIWPTESRWVSAELVRDGTGLAIAEMLSGGTTCFSDQYFFPEIVAETAERLHMRAMIGTPVLDAPTAWGQSASDYLNKGVELVHDRYADHPLVSSCFAPHAAYSLSDPGFDELRVTADQLDRRIQIHLHETADEVATAVHKTGRRPFQRLQELGFVNGTLLAVHAVHFNAAEIAEAALQGVSVAHCPRSNLKLASGIAPVAAMLKAGVNVAVGTDGAASNNAMDMISEMRSAALLAKATAEDAAAVPAHEALRMATLNGARALGLDDAIGTIETGKWADLACIDLSALNTQPVYDPVSQLVYSARANQVRDVWVAGRHQLDNGRLRDIDTDDLLARGAEWRDRIRGTR